MGVIDNDDPVFVRTPPHLEGHKGLGGQDFGRLFASTSLKAGIEFPIDLVLLGLPFEIWS